MKLPPRDVPVVHETSFSNDRPSRICVHELALAIERVVYEGDALTYADVDIGSREIAHALIQEMGDLPRCQMKGATGVEA